MPASSVLRSSLSPSLSPSNRASFLNMNETASVSPRDLKKALPPREAGINDYFMGAISVMSLANNGMDIVDRCKELSGRNVVGIRRSFWNRYTLGQTCLSLSASCSAVFANAIYIVNSLRDVPGLRGRVSSYHLLSGLASGCDAISYSFDAIAQIRTIAFINELKASGVSARMRNSLEGHKKSTILNLCLTITNICFAILFGAHAWVGGRYMVGFFMASVLIRLPLGELVQYGRKQVAKLHRGRNACCQLLT